MYLCLTILVMAIPMDLRNGRIPNRFCVMGVLASQAYVLLLSHSVFAAMKGLILGLCLMLILYPLFAIGAFGAGDIKLTIMLPAFLGFRSSLVLIALSFAAGAIIGVIKLVSHRILKERLMVFAHYLKEVSTSGKLGVYDLPPSLTGKVRSHQVHFSIPLFIGAVLTYGGFIRI